MNTTVILQQTNEIRLLIIRYSIYLGTLLGSSSNSLSNGLKRLQDVGQMFIDAFSDVSSVCNNAATYAYVNSICDDFNPTKWSDFYGVLQSCSDPYSSNIQAPNDFSAWSASGAVGTDGFKECLKGKVSSTDIPGGVSDNDIGKDITMLGFLDPSKNQIITFSSHAPVTLTYSSTVSDSLSFSSSFNQGDPVAWNVGVEAEAFVALCGGCGGMYPQFFM